MSKYAVTTADGTDVICNGDREFLDVLDALGEENVKRITTWKAGDPQRKEIPLSYIFW